MDNLTFLDISGNNISEISGKIANLKLKPEMVFHYDALYEK